MQNLFSTGRFTTYGFLSLRTTLAAMLATGLLFAVPAQANFDFSGDVIGTIPLEGGATGDITVGNTDLGGLKGDAEPAIDPLEPLVSPSAIIGNGPNGYGLVTMDSFFGQWDITGNMTVGKAGQGFIDILNAATMEVDGDLVVGEDNTGQGGIVIDATVVAAARLHNKGQLTVGKAGVGSIKVLERASLLSDGVALIGEDAGSDGNVLVTGWGARWSVGGALTVGGVVTSHGKLEIVDDALVQTSAATTVNSSGIIDLSGGTFRNLSATDITNSGLIRGSGFIDSSMTISPSGELRNYGTAGSYPPEEALRVSGPVDNDGTIESMGGEMEFESAVDNSLEIVARDAIMRFHGGLANTGVIIAGGDSTLHGTVTCSGGSLTVLSDSNLLLVGDLIFSSGIMSMAIGAAPGTFDVTGTANLAGALIDLSYSAGVMSQPGDTYQIFQAAGGIGGFTSGVAAADGRIWDITQSGNTLIATAAGVATPFHADFNGDGVVNAIDMGIWDSNYGSTGAPWLPGDADGDGDVDGADFLKIQRDFGGPPTSAFAAVPEPSSALLVLFGSLLVGAGSMGRKRS